MMLKTPLVSLALAFSLAASPVLAQVGPSAAPAPVAVEDRAPEGPEALVLQEQTGERSRPLGADIFEGTPPQATTNIVDPSYVMKPGDRLQVTLWGLVNESQELIVDAQGNVVVPGVGPVRVGGLTAAQAPGAIERASRAVYNEGVRVYAAPVGQASIQVLVTGPVERPGAYAGASDDALVVYLQRAGGIDEDRGSYRRIRIVRNGQTLALADLYAFLRAGELPDVSLRNGDAVVVEEQGPIVTVTGDVRAPFTFELAGATGLGSEIMQFARPRPGATHVAVVGSRDGAPWSAYLTLDEFSRLALRDGDRVQFETDSRAGQVLVRLEGAHQGPSVFTAPRGTTVGQILAQVPVYPNADMETIHLRRASVRETQKRLLDESLDRLERTIFLAPARSPSESAARSASLEFTTQWIARARQVEPLGILALNGQDLNQVRLETGDVLVIPQRSQVVTIAGEVNAPQSAIALGQSSVDAYVRMAGGYTRRADRRNVLVFRQDGQIRPGGVVMPGDRVLVSAKPDSTLLPFIRDITQVVFQIAGTFLAFDRVTN